ncbi:MAG: peroxidase family protein, partial [Planctomycetota bacterium]
PIYGPIAERFYNNPEEFDLAFAKAWYKLTHRDMGPHSRLLGNDVPPAQLWQDPVPDVDHPLVDSDDVADLERRLMASGLSNSDLVFAAWASASTFRTSDLRGGANGGRLRLAPQSGWAVNDPERLAGILATLGEVQEGFNSDQPGGKRISMADLIVLGGGAAIEAAAKASGVEVEVPFTPGRTDASAEMTDEASFGWLEPAADPFRNYVSDGLERRPEEAMVDRAQLLGLSAPEMTALIGGMRVLDVNTDGSQHGVFTDRVGALTNDFFVNLLDNGLEWTKVGDNAYEARDRQTGEVRWTGTRIDLVFGSNSQLRGLSEVYASSDGHALLVEDFVAAWTKVMNADRFDVK